MKKSISEWSLKKDFKNVEEKRHELEQTQRCGKQTRQAGIGTKEKSRKVGYGC